MIGCQKPCYSLIGFDFKKPLQTLPVLAPKANFVYQRLGNMYRERFTGLAIRKVIGGMWLTSGASATRFSTSKGGPAKRRLEEREVFVQF
jgi:hypothetical protein